MKQNMIEEHAFMKLYDQFNHEEMELEKHDPCHYNIKGALDFLKNSLYKKRPVLVIISINDIVKSNVHRMRSISDFGSHDYGYTFQFDDLLRDLEDNYRLGKIDLDEFCKKTIELYEDADKFCEQVVKKHKTICKLCLFPQQFSNKCTDRVEYCKTCGKNGGAKFIEIVDKCAACRHDTIHNDAQQSVTACSTK